MSPFETDGILSGIAIHRMIEEGKIEIDPWDPSSVNFADRLNPASYDLTLGSGVAVYSDVVIGEFDPPGRKDLIPGDMLVPYHLNRSLSTTLALPDRRYPEKRGYLDVKKKNPVLRYEMDDRGIMLMPGIGYLMHTVERIRTNCFVPIIDGKSSVGRLFATAHICAGFGDPGFDGQYTLEVVVTQPLVVYPNMRFCQMRFHTVVGEVETYKKKGSYLGILAQGPIESRAWKMFGDG